MVVGRNTGAAREIIGSPLRVLFVNENIGGHATVHHALAAALSERADIAAEFIAVPEPGLIGRVARLPIPGLAGIDLDLQPLRAQLVRSMWVRRALLRRLQRNDVDVLHVYTQNCALLSTSILRKVPSVVTTDSTTELNAYRIPYRGPARYTPWSVRRSVPLESRVFRAARRVIANSEYVASSLRSTYGLAEHQVSVLRFGIALPPPPADPPDRRPTIVFIGHQLERKGGNRLIRIHQQFLRDRCDLLLVTTEQVAPAPGLRVISDLRSGSERLWDVLAGADVMCFPSTIDQAPNAVLEAQAAALPVVAHPVGAVPEMVLHDRTGFLVPPEDDQALVRALETLIAQPVRRRAMGRNARRHVEERYDMKAIGNDLVKVLSMVRDDAIAVNRQAQDGPRPMSAQIT